ncbi:hypothetical protein [Actinoplanes sp. NPDC026619]|uniref:hypothetical protein n=1 Tax=Actinoplanes sp. NPDC026619 TaxID=3155798 RepID=UPI0033DDA497
MPADLDLHIRDAGAWDTAAVADVLTAAIATTSVVRWMLPATPAGTRQLPSRLVTLVSEQITRRRVRVVDDAGRLTAAIVWTTCTSSADLVPDPGAVLLDVEGDAHRSRLLHTLLAQRHPTRAHHHLLAIGVHPARQRHGIGTALLADWHQHLAAEPAEVFLLAPNPLLALARNAGYHTIGQPITPMLSAPPIYVLGRTLANSPTPGPIRMPVTAGVGATGQPAPALETAR